MSKPIISADFATLTGGVSLGNNVETVVLNSPVVTVTDAATAVIIWGTITCIPLGTSTAQLAIFCRRGTGLAGVQIGREAYLGANLANSLSNQNDSVSGMWVDQIPGRGAQQWTINGFAVSATTGSTVLTATIVIMLV